MNDLTDSPLEWEHALKLEWQLALPMQTWDEWICKESHYWTLSMNILVEIDFSSWKPYLKYKSMWFWQSEYDKEKIQIAFFKENVKVLDF